MHRATTVDSNPPLAATAGAPSAPPASATASRLSDLECWVDEHGDYLFKFALTRLRDTPRAEDLVHETFLAAPAFVAAETETTDENQRSPAIAKSTD